MSREIKFRTWVKMYDDSDGVMLNMPMNIHHFDFEDGIVISFTDYPEFYGHENYDDREPKLPHEINIMQYTGLKDKNGKEIYEGDVVKSNNNHLFVINFKYGSFGANWIKDDFVWHSFATNSFIEKKFEVVGNIYEHKYLLDKNQEEND